MYGAIWWNVQSFAKVASDDQSASRRGVSWGIWNGSDPEVAFSWFEGKKASSVRRR
jgi:hypothetical protein